MERLGDAVVCKVKFQQMRIVRFATFQSVLAGLVFLNPAAAEDEQAVVTKVSTQASDDVEGEIESVASIDQLVVVGTRSFGSVLGSFTPIYTLDQYDIESYGASDLSELLEALGPLIGPVRRGGAQSGPPFLLNGERISSFREIRRYPSEAIARVEVLPPEAGVQYGFPPTQRVVNFILRDRFSVTEVDIEVGAPTEGGRVSTGIEVERLQVANDRRLNFVVEYLHEDALFEAERDIESVTSDLSDLVGNVTSTAPGAEIDPACPCLLAVW